MEKETNSDSNTHFVKIHAPLEVINLNAEVAGLKPTVREYRVTYCVHEGHGLYPKSSHSHGRCHSMIAAIWRSMRCDTIAPEPSIFSPGIPLAETEDRQADLTITTAFIQS